MLGAQSIQLGQSSVVVCGGQESMSRVPHAMLIRSGVRMGNGTMSDPMIYDGLTDAFNQYHMGVTGNWNFASVTLELWLIDLFYKSGKCGKRIQCISATAR